MAYDFDTDIANLTREDNLPSTVIDWAVDYAKTYYIAGDPSGYNEDLSAVDNRLVSILASAFILLYIKSLEIPQEFKLDEFSIKESQMDFDKNAGEILNRYFGMFFSWLNLYLMRGISLQYVDNGQVILISEYSPRDLIAELDFPEGLEQ